MITLPLTPVINATITDNTECGGTFNGDITIEIDGGSPDAGYMINWVDVASGDDLDVAVPGVFITPNRLIATRVPPGNYRVEVTDDTPDNEGCMASANFTVLDNPAILSITDPDDLILVSNDKCTAPYTGSAMINFVKENGVQMPTDGYTFLWSDASMSMVAGSGNGPTLSGLNSGTYSVTATNTTTGCSRLTSFEIEDITTPPVVNLVKFINPTKCNGSDSGGSLSVDADGSTNITNYTFAWYTGGVPVAGAPFEPNNPDVSNQTAQSYTVGVTNVLSGCVTYETYTLTDVVAPVILSTSSSPVTNCDADNGVAFAKVISTDSDYNYMWYTGNQTTPDLSNSEYTGQNWMGRSAGEYTVVAIDIYDADCVSDPSVVTIGVEQVFPVVQIAEDAPLINCDPTQPNGQLSATADGNITGYIFEWFNGTHTSGTPDYVGAIYSQLTSGINYTVRATDIITSCSTELSQMVSENFPIIPIPEITLVSNRNNCVNPNGSLSATVDGSINGYNFEWYLGANANATTIGTDALIEDLDIGQYTVKAIDIATGCSSTEQGEIIDERTFTEFEVEIINSSCAQSNGSIEITALKGFLIDSISWILPSNVTTPASPYTSPTLGGFPQGHYTYTVYGPGGCGVDGEADIIDDIIVYNGISSNNDDANDHFIIECIQNFENNDVKIYNRSGQLVYEAKHYDNDNTRFVGEGNKGIYVSGKEVPDGTYFYIVDKGDGSEPKTGYLELTR